MEDLREMIEDYYAEKGLNTKTLSSLAPGFLYAIGYGANYIQNGKE